MEKKREELFDFLKRFLWLFLITLKKAKLFITSIVPHLKKEFSPAGPQLNLSEHEMNVRKESNITCRHTVWYASCPMKHYPWPTVSYRNRCLLFVRDNNPPPPRLLRPSYTRILGKTGHNIESLIMTREPHHCLADRRNRKTSKSGKFRL